MDPYSGHRKSAKPICVSHPSTLAVSRPAVIQVWSMAQWRLHPGDLLERHVLGPFPRPVASESAF